MSCGTRSEKTKACSSAAIGAPTATSAVAKLKARIAEITQDKDQQAPEEHEAPKVFGPEWGDY